MMTNGHGDLPLPETEEGLRHLLDNLTFHPDRPVEVEPPVLALGEDVLVPRSAKIPLSLDEGLKEMAARRGLPSKSALMVEYLLRGLAEDRAAIEGREVLVPLSEVLGAIQGLRGLRPTA